MAIHRYSRVRYYGETPDQAIMLPYLDWGAQGHGMKYIIICGKKSEYRK
jgi:hypothetical protein